MKLRYLTSLIFLGTLLGSAAASEPVFNVRDFGAAGDGITFDSKAINAAIEKAAASGGGKVLVPPGTYLTGSIRLKSHINLHIEKGAELLGAPAALGYWIEQFELRKRVWPIKDTYVGNGGVSGGYVNLIPDARVYIDNQFNAFSVGDKIRMQFYVKSPQKAGKVRFILLERTETEYNRYLFTDGEYWSRFEYKTHVLAEYKTDKTEDWQKVELSALVPEITENNFLNLVIEHSSGGNMAIDELLIQYEDRTRESLFSYDAIRPITQSQYKSGGHNIPLRNSLIWGENLENITISGKGMINGRNLRTANLVINSDPASLRVADKGIALRSCRNVTLRDFTLYRGGHFAILPTACENLLVENITIDSQRDGIDPDCCKNFIIRNSRVNTPGDDAICLKSSIVLGKRIACENGFIENCTVSAFSTGSLLSGEKKRKEGHRNGRIKLGTDALGGFRNIRVINCVFESCHGLAIEEVDGALTENIVFENITMSDCYEYAIYVTSGDRNRGPESTAKVSMMQNVVLRNIRVDGTEKECGIQICGTPSQPIQGIHLENITLISDGGGSAEDARLIPRELGRGYPEAIVLGTMPSYGLFARHVVDGVFRNIKFSTKEKDLRPAIVLSNVQDIRMDDIEVQGNPGVKVIEIREKVKDLEIIHSPTLRLEH